MRHFAQDTVLGHWCTLVLAYDTFNIVKGVRFPHALPKLCRGRAPGADEAHNLMSFDKVGSIPTPATSF